MKAEIIAVINQKGGSAKTTTTLSMAAYLATLGKRVLIVDVDPQGDATLGLNITLSALKLTVYDVLVQGASIKEIIYSSALDNLHIAPSNVSLSKTDINLADQERKAHRLKDALSEVNTDYDFIFVDCPPSLGLLPVNALVAATRVLVPIPPQYFAMEGLKQVNRSVRDISVSLNPGLELSWIQFCMVDYRLRLTKPSMKMVREHFGEKVLNSEIRLCSRLNEASVVGQTIFQFSPQSRAAVDYSHSVQEMLSKRESVVAS